MNETRIEAEHADSFEVEVEAIQPDGFGSSHSWRISLTALESLPEGRFSGNLYLALDDSQNPEVKVQFSGFVR